jgi:hypothetical protein
LDSKKTVVFTVSKGPLGIGQYVQFGKYYGTPIKWRVIHVEDDGTPILFSDKILTIKAFDAKGSNHVNNDSDRTDYGSNNYENSNLRQWLNSDEQSIEWKQNQPSAENMWNGYNAYDTEKGFLADGNFTATERSYVKSRTHKVLLAEVDKGQADGGSEAHVWESNITEVVQNYDSAWYKNLTDDVFLLSVKDLKEYVYDNRSTLGDDYYIGEPTAQAVTNSTYKSDNLKEGNKWYYWLNSPGAEVSGSVRVADSYGDVDGYGAYTVDCGVRPALLLNLSSAIFTSDGQGTSEAPYVVKAQ